MEICKDGLDCEARCSCDTTKTLRSYLQHALHLSNCAAPQMSKSEGRVLLPPSVEPKAYDISIEPNLVDFTFTGSEKIAVNVRRLEGVGGGEEQHK